MTRTSTTNKQLRITRVKSRFRQFLDRREHRAFRVTRRRDYTVATPLPGYWAFSWRVASVMRDNWKLLLGLGLVYIVLSVVLVGLFSQDTYTYLADQLAAVSDGELGGMGALSQSGVLLYTIVTGGVSGQLGEAQQIYTILIGLLMWLSIVWALRAILAGKKVKLRDTLYNAGAPIVPTFIIVLFMLVQLVPFALGLIVLSAAQTGGLLNIPIVAALVWLGVILLGILTLYWVSTTAVALVIVTLPGMYPWRAIRSASDLVLGRRLLVMYRLVWLIFGMGLISVVILVPFAALINWLNGIWEWLAVVPIVPFTLLVASALVMVYGASYIYMLYRGIVDGLETD